MRTWWGPGETDASRVWSSGEATRLRPGRVGQGQAPQGSARGRGVRGGSARRRVLVYGRRRHTISLLVFRADGLRWPQRGLEPLGAHRAATTSVRGFNVLLWRVGDLGYALVSDLAPGELRELGLRFTDPERS